MRWLSMFGGVLALGGGVLFGAGCPTPWTCNCPPVAPFVGGVFDVHSSSDPHIVGGTVEAVGDTVVMEYTDDEGIRWQATWDIVERWGE